MRIVAQQLIKITLIFIPVIIFAVLYFVLGLCPNYLFGSVDTEGLYHAEISLFGLESTGGAMITPSEYCSINHEGIYDLMSGFFYLLWLPMPFMYFIALHFQGHERHAVRAAAAFLTVNIIGFIIYYIHPACPPWYVMQHGFDVDFNTMGDPAGFKHFDEIVGYPFFRNFYSHNANVFASIPSLHAAYTPVAFYYSMRVKKNTIWRIVLAIVSVGIWFSAVYSGHHYIIDVVLGVCTTMLGLLLFESWIRKTKPWKRYEKAITHILRQD